MQAADPCPGVVHAQRVRIAEIHRNLTATLQALWPQKRRALRNVQPRGAPKMWTWPMWLAWLTSRQPPGTQTNIVVIGANPECLSGVPVSPITCQDIMFRFIHAQHPRARMLLVDADAGNLEQAVVGYGAIGPNVITESYHGALASPCGSWAHRAVTAMNDSWNSTACCPKAARPGEQQNITFWQATRCTRMHSAFHLPWLTGVGNLGDAGAAWTHTKGGAMEPVSVACTSAGALLRARGFASIDALHLDVEGSEFAVLASILEEGVRPSVVMFELKIVIDQHGGMLAVRLLNLLGLHSYVAFGLGAGPHARVTQDFMAVDAAMLLQAQQ